MIESYDIPPDVQVVQDRENSVWFRTRPGIPLWTQFPGFRIPPPVPEQKLRGYGPFIIVSREQWES